MSNVEKYPTFWQTLHFTLKMATAMFAETLDNSQHLIRLNSESQSYTEILLPPNPDLLWTHW
jgi:hypothetical protein